MPIIKRYSNRKLYDSQARCYITLDDIRKMIQAGEPIEVIDHQTGENLTTSTMAQIIFEQEKHIGGLLPRVILANLIQIGDTAIHAIQDSIHAFTDPMQFVEDEIQRRIKILQKQNAISTEEAQHLVNILTDPIFRSSAQVSESEQTIETANIKDVQAILEKIEDLDKQLDELIKKKSSRI